MSIQCVVVTPEKTAFDGSVDSLVLPMFDGELGVQSGRAPMIGRLGYGVLRTTAGNDTRRYFVDGGFVQIENNVVNVLTGFLTPIEDLDSAQTETELADALALPSTTPVESDQKQTALLRARGRRRAAKSS